MSTQFKDIVIVGSGISGLTCAHELHKKNKDFMVLESKEECGGNMKSDAKKPYLLELGPNSFLASAEDIWGLVEDLQLEGELSKSYDTAHNRFIFRDGICQKLPSSILEFITTKLFSFKTKLLILTEPFRTGRGDDSDSAETFFIRRFGKEFTDVVISSFVSGIYAGNVALLHAKSAFPLFWGFEKKHGSMIRGAFFHMRGRSKTNKPKRKGIWSFKNGLQTLPKAIERKIGNRVLFSTSVESATKENGKFILETNKGKISCNHLILASPPPASSRILKSISSESSAILSKIPLAPIVVVHMSTDDVDKVPNGFGMLIPRSQNIDTLGVLFSSRTFPGRAPNGKEILTVFIGGTMNPDLISKDPEEIVKIVKQDLKTTLGISAESLSFERITKWNASIPQMILDHDKRIAQLEKELESVEGLHICGNFLTGVGIKDAVSTAKVVAERF